MLVLTRHASQSIVIGEEAAIEVIVLSVNGSQVKMGVKAPKDVPVHRNEIFEKILAEKLSNQTKENKPYTN